MSFPSTLRILIVEPNPQFDRPYFYLDQLFPQQPIITRVASIREALTALDSTFNIVFLSSGFSPSQSLQFLETLKNTTETHLPSLVFVVDWSQRIHRVLGTTWASQVGILHSLSSQEEVIATLHRLNLLG